VPFKLREDLAPDANPPHSIFCICGRNRMDRARNEHRRRRFGARRIGYWRGSVNGFDWLRFDGDGQMPAGFGRMRALQDGERDFQPDGQAGWWDPGASRGE
jgi:hypothetical protein